MYMYVTELGRDLYWRIILLLPLLLLILLFLVCFWCKQKTLKYNTNNG